MAAATASAPNPSRRLAALPSLLDANRRPPPSCEGLVPRTRLIRYLLEARDVPLVLLVAPAGYGKTTVVSQWARRDKRPFVWLTLDADNNEPAQLLASISRALETVEPNRSFVLVIDGVHVLRERASFEILTAFVEELPKGSQLALTSRSEPAMPVGRLRAHRKVVELRPRDLVMAPSEAAVLFSATGLNLGGGVVETLVRRTEGWAAGLYLTALSLRKRADLRVAVEQFSGDDPLVADYLRDEILSGLSQDVITFLTRASMLERLSGPACDAVLERTDSARELAELARSNMLLFPTDSGGCYRYHGLLAGMLRADLRRLEPEREAELHRRAAVWYADRGDSDGAIAHAIESRDAHLAGEVLWVNHWRYIAYGHNATVQGWLDRFSEDETAAHPALALVAASSQFASGDRNLVEHWASAAARELDTATQTDSVPSLEAAVAILRAGIAADGITRMGTDAAHAYDLFSDQTPWRSVCCLLSGAARHLSGDREPARAYLEEGARRGAVAAPNIQALCLAQLAMLALEDDDWANAEAHATQARAQVERFGLSDYPTSALVFAVSAAMLARIGRVDGAKIDAGRASELMAKLTNFAPWYEIEARVALVWAALRLSDVVAARSLIEEAARLLSRIPDAIVLREWVDELWIRVDSAIMDRVAARQSLTTAELRVLQFLPTHLSFPEVAEQLNVSANTIKTHARAVYRKLDARSRAQAVAHARDAGLIDANRLFWSEAAAA